MGSGKGAPDGWVCVIRPGKILFEMEGVTEELAREALRLAQQKLSVASEFITRTPPEE
jgi:large subunit ribosomal protein L16